MDVGDRGVDGRNADGRTGPAGRTVRVDAPAKINLYLHLLGRRADGLHRLDSLIVFAGVRDTVTAEAARDLTVTLDGPFAERLPADSDNLVLRAARLMAEACGPGDRPGAAIRLTKRLPVAAGVGGGSADAAATMLALMRLWKMRPDRTLLDRIALTLGADVPVCLAGIPCFVGGIGERLEPAPPLPPTHFVLVNPGVPLPTAAVFQARSGPFSEAARFIEAPTDTAALAALLATRRNDLTAAACGLAPAVAAMLAALDAAPGCLLARMSGSGATGFGLFANAAAAAAAARTLATANPGWWVAAAPLLTGEAPGLDA